MGTMIITTVIYAVLQAILEGLLKCVVAVSNAVLDESITVFNSGLLGVNIFDRFVALIPFTDPTIINSTIKAIAYSIIVLFVLFAAIKSVFAPALADDKAPNPVQAIIRGVVAVFLIIIIFGTSNETLFGYNLLTQVGRLFGAILGNIPKTGSFNYTYTITDLNPAFYITNIILVVTLVVSVFGAAITYVERVISLAVTVIIGPVAVAMYASSDTADTAKQWAMSILTQFLAIFLSLILWQAFMNQLSIAFNTPLISSEGSSVFNFAVAIAILSIVKNSEKILNTFGLRTMTLGDSARSVMAGLSTIAGATMMAMRFSNSYRKGKAVGGNKEENLAGNVYDSDNAIKYNEKSKEGKVLGTGTVGGFVNSNMNYSYVASHKQQRDSIAVLGSSVGNDVTSQSVNTAFGFTDTTKLKAVGDSSGNMKAVSFDTGVRPENAAEKDPNITANGWMGNFTYQNNGVSKTLQDSVVLADNSSISLKEGTYVGENSSGEKRYISDTSYVLDDKGHRIYNTMSQTEYDRKTKQANTPAPDADYRSDYQSNVTNKTIVGSVTHKNNSHKPR